MRFFAGRSGAAKFGIEGFVRRADGTELARFVAGRASAGSGPAGKNPVFLVQKCIQVVGQDVAQMIASGAYQTEIEDW